jgi:hypothetical protein
MRDPSKLIMWSPSEHMLTWPLNCTTYRSAYECLSQVKDKVAYKTKMKEVIPKLKQLDADNV